MITTFGEYIKKSRVDIGYTLKKVATQLEIDTSTLGKIERGERNLSENLLMPISDILKKDQKEVINYYYSSKITQDFKNYPFFKDVLDIAARQIELNSSNLNQKKNWTEKEFKNPNSNIRLATMFSGIGAIEYAFRRLKLSTDIIFASDNDKYVKQSYFSNLTLKKKIGTLM